MAEVEKPAPVWTIAANVVRHRRYGDGGRELRPGTKTFRGGAKVYVPDGYPGMAFEKVTAVGYGRRTRRYIAVATSLRNLHAFRAVLVRSPAVLRLIEDGYRYLTWPTDRAAAVEQAASFERMARADRAGHWGDGPHPAPCLCVECVTEAGPG
ncbi:hypothetical protein [Streptosporangium sp. KLBMP 9127]|nr:hypothetical protein [Streptosporangium sp. KLBMP 9127]